jgi:hypothetical protein
MKWLDHLPWSGLIIAALLLGSAPFGAQPHLFEKIGMLLEGTLVKPLDIFDLLMHATPILLILLKGIYELQKKQGNQEG